MNAPGRQLLIVSSREVLDRAKRFGARVTAELCQLEGGSKFVARIVMSHVLLPGQRAQLGLLFVENDGAESVVVAGSTLDEAESAVRAALPGLASRVNFTASAERATLHGGDAAIARSERVRAT